MIKAKLSLILCEKDMIKVEYKIVIVWLYESIHGIILDKYMRKLDIFSIK